MAILTSLFSGISGLNAFGSGLSVISDNIANMNTVGFKDSKISFSDIISESLGSGGGGQIGRGVFVSDIRTEFSQGSFETSGNVLDLALEGEGFFIVQNPAGSEFYTRAGTFSLDQNGFVENPAGLRLQGTLFDASGTSTNQVGDIDLGVTSFAPSPTANVDIALNLDASVPINSGFVVATAAATSNFSTSISVLDTLGASHQVDVYFRKSAATGAGVNTWQYFGVNSSSGAPLVEEQGTLVFAADGTLTSRTQTAGGGFVFPSLSAQQIDFRFGSTTSGTGGFPTGAGSGLDGATQFGSSSAVANQAQDGSPSGTLQSIAIDEDGFITGIFTNGRSRTLAQLEIARFNNEQGLEKIGNSVYALTRESGDPISGVANSAGRGKVLSNSLELSNVDLAEQFVKMIEFQRGFQANSRVITTTDDILQELVNLRR